MASAKSDQSLRCPHEESLGPELPIKRKQRLWSDWADAQADLSLRWAHSRFVGFFMSWLICHGHKRMLRIADDSSNFKLTSQNCVFYSGDNTGYSMCLNETVSFAFIKLKKDSFAFKLIYNWLVLACCITLVSTRDILFHLLHLSFSGLNI